MKNYVYKATLTGRCANCGGPIQKGDAIQWRRRETAKDIGDCTRWHAACADLAAAPGPELATSFAPEEN